MTDFNFRPAENISHPKMVVKVPRLCAKRGTLKCPLRKTYHHLFPPKYFTKASQVTGRFLLLYRFIGEIERAITSKI